MPLSRLREIGCVPHIPFRSSVRSTYSRKCGRGPHYRPLPHFLEPAIGLEPMTCSLRVSCSTTELRRPGQMNDSKAPSSGKGRVGGRGRPSDAGPVTESLHSRPAGSQFEGRPVSPTEKRIRRLLRRYTPRNDREEVTTRQGRRARADDPWIRDPQPATPRKSVI